MRRKRKKVAKNKLHDSLEGSLIKVDPEPHFGDVPQVVLRSKAVVVARNSLFNEELERAIEIIARERVYRAFLAGLGRRLLPGPTTSAVDGEIEP